jgi:hypothetical protein
VASSTCIAWWGYHGDRPYAAAGERQTLSVRGMRPSRSSGLVILTRRWILWQCGADCRYNTRKHERIGPNRKVTVMRTTQKWVGTLVILAALLLISATPGHTDRGGHGYRGHGHGGHGHRGHWHGGHGHRGHWHGGARVFISPSFVVPFGPYWRPYWEPYGYPPVVVAPSPRVYVQPSSPVAVQPPPPSYWYYCEESRAYYPYVEQCPGGWRTVTPTPP